MKKGLLLLCLVLAVRAAAVEPWTWKDATGTVRSQAELDSILSENTKWVNSGGREGTQGELTHADLHGASLANRDLRGLDLTQANLDGADLTAANLNSPDQGQTDLTQASLRRANLNGAHLKGVYLGGGDIHLPGAKLNGARMTNADLTDADLTNANLAGADLQDAVLTGAELEGAELKNVLFQPSAGPGPSQIGTAQHLADLRYGKDPEPIVSLRNALLDAGFEQAGREVNRAYHRHKENAAQRLLFDWTCAWGADPLRPLKIVGMLCALCTLIYWVAMHFEMKKAGLYLVMSGKSVADDTAKEQVTRISVVPPRSAAIKAAPALEAETSQVWHSLIRRPGLELQALLKALFFSLMSIFTIGVEGFDGSQWMRMMMPREFDIRARGWLRTVSGIQALLGAGLIALSLLSYFGHPFW
ncbi:MAG: pentapeptide repeat-containing protein [Terracidiphilus sp.]|jgi:uncharacterized protein YjbI with pentapeptide repeats